MDNQANNKQCEISECECHCHPSPQHDALRQRRHTGAELVPSRQIYLVTEPLLKGPSEATALVRTRERPLRNDVLFSFLL